VEEMAGALADFHAESTLEQSGREWVS